MTNTESVCKAFNQPAPNMNHDTGIHYGVIHSHNVDSWCMDSIYMYGEDLGYEESLREFKDRCNSAAREILQVHADDEIGDVPGILNSWLSDYIRKDDLKRCADNLNCEDYLTAKELGEDIYSGLEEDFIDSMSFCESGPYLYHEDGYQIRTRSDGDLFIIKSPYYTLCAECSPCAPNAGYTLAPGSMKTYCLGPEWFEEDIAPYDVYAVDGDKMIQNGPKDNA